MIKEILSRWWPTHKNSFSEMADFIAVAIAIGAIGAFMISLIPLNFLTFIVHLICDGIKSLKEKKKARTATRKERNIMTESGFKPCPFCGGTEVRVIVKYDGINKNFVIAECGTPSCLAMVVGERYGNRLDHDTAAGFIAERWNRRANDA